MRTTVTVFAVLAGVALVPIIWAIVDVLRRPASQFSPGRKAVWTLTLGLGWLVLWPVALVTSLIYLTVLRRRFPPAGEPAGPPAPPFPGYGAWPPQSPQFPVQPPPPPAQLPPAGWYPDPAGGGGERWWDGVGWTDYLR